MLLHTVLFWLKPGLSAAEVSAFVSGVRTLTSIPSVRFGFVGTPAATRRPVIDHSYSYKLVVGFDDLAGHDAYQVDPVHLAFIAACSGYWERVLIYDADAVS